MIAVIFEFEPLDDGREQYLEHAQRLAAALQDADGFISIERFESMTTPGRLLSLSFWRDEQAVTDWRNRAEHRQAQASARESLFSQYRLRVASVMRDYGMTDRTQAPADSRQHHL